jgi:hypothetical protein
MQNLLETKPKASQNLGMTGHTEDNIVHSRGPKPMNTRQGHKDRSDGRQ